MPPQTPSSSPRENSRVLRSHKVFRSTGQKNRPQSITRSRNPTKNSDNSSPYPSNARLYGSLTLAESSEANDKNLDRYQAVVEENGVDSSTVFEPDRRVLMVVRSAIVLLFVAMYWWSDHLQACVDSLWEYLRHAWWFRTVYFETVWATLTYAYIIPIPFTMHFIHWFDRYKVDKSTTYIHQTVVGILLEAVIYMAPLAFLDTITVKKYWGVHPEEWDIRRLHWIQTTRALPVEPPMVFQIIYQVLGSVVIFDALFFFIHLALHKYRPLYTLVHEHHHSHDIMHAHVTNQLTVAERIMLILAANQALKILYSHPLSRFLYVPVFIGLLVDNHCGYDLPWGLQHILPKGIWGGPRLHHAHHMLSTRQYQPFLTYLDCALQWWESRQSKASSRTVRNKKAALL